MMRGLLPLSPSVTMNAAAPDRAPPQRIGDYQKKSFCPQCLGEALRRGSFVERTIFMVRVWTYRFMLVSMGAQETIVITVIILFMRGELKKRQRYKRSPETYHEGLLFWGYRCPAQGEYDIQANVYLIELAAPVEELLTVAIDDAANTLFITGITGFRCH